MESYKAYKFRLYPTVKQRNYFYRCFGCGRMVYNWALAMKNEAYEKDKTNLSIRKDISPKIPLLKEERPFLKEVDAKGLICELNAVDTAYKNFFQRHKKDNVGFPKYKHKGSSGSYTTQLIKGAIHQDDGYVILPKCGAVKCVFHRKIDGIVKETPYVTISRTTTGEFYISILALCEIPDAPKSVATGNNTIGIDMGLKDLAILSDGTKFHKVEVDDKLERRKKHLQRKLSKKVGSKKGQKKSNNYLKLQRQISKIDEKVARRREHYHYAVVSEIASMPCDYIGIEDLSAKNMSATGRSKDKKSAEEYAKLTQCEKKKYNRKKNKGFNKSILNAGFYSFKTKLEHKAAQNGKEVVTIGRFYASSQTCSVCGAKNKRTKNLGVREWTCPECGTHHDRDVNAAKNIRNEAIRIKNEKGEPTPKNLRRCTPKVKSAESHRSEKSVSDGVVSRLVEPEIQVIHCSNTAKSEVITESQVVVLQE